MVAPVEVEEATEGDPAAVAAENARRKARAAAAEHAAPGARVLGADTVVALDRRILPKPGDAREARRWLELLSGREHTAWTAICLVEGAEEREALSSTAVRFRDLAEAEVDWYVASGEWHDRAGAYAIQGLGAALVDRIEGDYLTVVGLPVPALLDLLGPEWVAQTGNPAP